MRSSSSRCSKPGQGKLIYTDIFEAFFVEMKVAFFAAMMLAFPFIATQVWQFVAPGLYARRRRRFFRSCSLTPLFFLDGAELPILLPSRWALHFLLGFQGDIGGIQQEALAGAWAITCPSSPASCSASGCPSCRRSC